MFYILTQLNYILHDQLQLLINVERLIERE